MITRLLAWYRNWRNPIRLTPTEALHLQNAAYRQLRDEMSGIPAVMHGEAGFVPVSYNDGRPCTETEIGNFGPGPISGYTEEAAKMYEEKNDDQ